MADLAQAYAHCEALMRTEDRDAWLAALFAPPDVRPRLHALGAFATEIAQIRERVRQPIAGEIRLQWWQDVLDGERGAEAAAHPVAAALVDTVAAASLPAIPFGDMLDVHRLMLYDEPPADLAALEGRLTAARGAPVRLAGLALGGDDSAMVPAAADAGVALGIADLMRGLGRGEHRILLPVDLLGWHGATQADIDAGRPTPAVLAALGDLRIAARGRLDDLGRRRRTLGPAGPAFLTAALVAPRLERSAKAADPFAPAADIPQWRRQFRLWRAARAGGVL